MVFSSGNLKGTFLYEFLGQLVAQQKPGWKYYGDRIGSIVRIAGTRHPPD